MGYNRGGARRTARLKRHRNEQRRLASQETKSSPASPAAPAGVKPSTGQAGGTGS
jgi:hypothetical protein